MSLGARQLALPEMIYRRMLDHAHAEFPMEAVGLLAGSPDGRVQTVMPLLNRAGPGAYLADPYAQYLAEQAVERAGIVSLAVYHSHPGGGAGLSDLDRELAAQVPLIQVVIAVARPDGMPDDVRAYRVRGATIDEVKIRLDPGLQER